MHAKGKRDVDALSISPKLNDINNLRDKHHKQFQETDNIHLNRKVVDDFKYSDKEDKSLAGPINPDSQSIDAFTMEKISTESIAARNNVYTWKYDVICNILNTKDRSIPQKDVMRSFGHTSWKYKNPYSISINNLKHHGKLSHTSEDEPQEGRKKQSDCQRYLANYQESCNTSHIEYSFAALIIIMAYATARSLWALLYVIVNVAPIIQMFTFILRFVLEKVINIRKTKNFQQAVMKFSILAVQLLSVYICLIFILGFIILPIVQMAVGIVAKLVMHD